MQLFRSEETLTAWLAQHNLTLGGVLTLAQTWALSKLWYSDRMSADFRGRTLDDVQRIFKQVGLMSDFWRRR